VVHWRSADIHLRNIRHDTLYGPAGSARTGVTPSRLWRYGVRTEPRHIAVSAHALSPIMMKGISREVIPFSVDRVFDESSETRDVIVERVPGLGLLSRSVGGRRYRAHSLGAGECLGLASVGLSLPGWRILRYRPSSVCGPSPPFAELWRHGSDRDGSGPVADIELGRSVTM
jgi:hypothetical protein